MRKFLLGTFLSLTLLTGVGFAAPVTAHAAGPAQTVTSAKDAAETSAANKPEGYGQKDVSLIAKWTIVPIMHLGAWLLGMAAITLDTTVYYTVVHMGSIVGGTNGLSAIGVAWRVLRDIGNIILIFGFVALGITVILQVDWYGGGTRMLPKLLLAAIFLNFSLFISEAVIDVGNLFATQFYTQINGGNAPAPLSYGQVYDEGISNKIMAQLGFQSFYGAALDTNQDVLKEGNVWLIGTFGTLLFLIAAFVFLTLAFVLIARFVILTLLIIVAPIGFAGLAVPKLSSVADQWWNKLFEQVITAPVLLLLLYVALAVITDAKFLTNFGGVTSDSQIGWLGFIGNSGKIDLGSSAGMLLSFFVAMGLLLAVTFTTKKMSAFGAGQATKWGSRLSGLGLTAAGVGLASRNTVGALGRWGANGVRRAPFGRTFAGRAFADTLENRVGKASFDVRNSGVYKNAGAVGLDLGKGQKGGYVKDLENRVSAYKKVAENIQGADLTPEQKATLKETEQALEKASSLRDSHQMSRDEAYRAEAASREAFEAIEKERASDPATWDAVPGNEDRYLAAVKQKDDSKAAREKLDATLKATAAEVKEYEAQKKRIEGIKTGNTQKAKAAYAKRLEKGWGKYTPLMNTAFKEAGKKIAKDLKQNPDAKTLEALIKTAEKAGKESEKADK